MKLLNTITYTTRDGNGQRHEWTVGIQSSRKLSVIDAEKILKRDAPSAIVTRVETLIDSRPRKSRNNGGAGRLCPTLSQR